MIDTPPSATPMPEQPVAAVTNLEAPSPAADPLPPDFVPPSVTDPISNLDFPPVDDAFALEMRSETIEQLAGGDALRRGESERIEAGRSQTNADRVAGRDRVRVHATLHEHTGHALAEQAAHLHTTVDGRLDVHAASEDTVLLAGHMRELWDGGAAIVAAMTDDTVGGGGIRVTTPLDLWVHGLMGVEERIGTCTADAVLLELCATHYEREYGPGAHAAGLAVYTGSLYQSSRSTFRALMRVSSGVRNLIAGGGGGGGSGDGGAEDAPGASPPPAQTGAAEESATATLAAGRTDAQAPATALDTADALTDARGVSLEALVDCVDARVGEDMGEAGAVMRAENLAELTRSTDTGEWLGALQETLRIDGAASGSEVAGGLRTSELDGAVSKHSVTGQGGPLEIAPPSAICGENAPMVPPHPGVAWGQGPTMKLGLRGGADRPPQPPAPKSGFVAAYRRLRELRNRYRTRPGTHIGHDAFAAALRVSRSVNRQFQRFGGRGRELAKPSIDVTTAELAYIALQETARQADQCRNPQRAGAIREALVAIEEQALEELQALCTKFRIADAPSTQAMQRPPVTAGPTVTVAAIPPPAHAPVQFDWFATHTQLRNLASRFSHTGDVARADFVRAIDRISKSVMRRFRNLGGDSRYVLDRFADSTRAEQAYRALEDMSRQATSSGNVLQDYLIRCALEAINGITSAAADTLTTRHGALDALTTQDIRAMQLPPPRVGPATSAALPVNVRPPVSARSTTVPRVERSELSVPAHPIAQGIDPEFYEPVDGLADGTDVPGPPLAFGLPGPSLAEAAGARAGDLEPGWLDPTYTVSGATATEPAATGTIVTPSLDETSSLWLQPADPGPAPGSVPFDSGLPHAGETVQPPPVTTIPGSTAPGPGASFLTTSWLEDDFDVERALLAGLLPPRFDASRLIAEAGTFEPFGLAGELAAGRLPVQSIDRLIEGYRRATGEGDSYAPYIEYLISLKERIERALRAAYPERVDRKWLDKVQELLYLRDQLAAPNAGSATGLPEFEVTEIDRLVGTGEGVSHPAPLPTPSGPWRTGAGAETPPPAAEPWRIRPPGMGGEPHPVAFGTWSAPPGPSSHVVSTEAIRPAALPAGASPGWQGAETTGFARAASGAVELPLSRRQRIARRFGTDDALSAAEHAFQTGRADALGWSDTRWSEVLTDLYGLNAIVQSNSAAKAAMIDIDWSAIEALVRILEALPPSP